MLDYQHFFQQTMFSMRNKGNNLEIQFQAGGKIPARSLR